MPRRVAALIVDLPVPYWHNALVLTDRNNRIWPQLLLFLLVCVGTLAARSPSQSPVVSASSKDVALTITGAISKPLSLSLADLGNLPQTTVKVLNSHEGKEEVYEGVSLTELLTKAGIPQGEKLRGPEMATYLLAEGADGYRVVLSIAEADSSFQDSQILVAYKMNGQPLGAAVGPLRLIVPHDLRPGRWVRMLQSIKVTTVPE